METADRGDARPSPITESRSGVIAVVAGGNLIAIPSGVAVWLLRRDNVIGGPPFWVYFLLIAGSVGVDFVGRAWLARRPDSELRRQTRVVVAASVVTTIVYSTGWGSALTVAYALCALQMLAQIPGIDWRVVLGWCVASAVGGEVALQFGAPHFMTLEHSHIVAAISLCLLAGVLWIVSGILAARDVIESALRDREQRLAHQAATDSLTMLLNRAAFTKALERSCAAGEPAILAFVDLDNFKDVNDTFGHHVGDEVLIEVGVRLRRVVREEDVIARFGGDEFVILVGSAHVSTDASLLVERIRAVLAEPWPMIAPNTISASVGVVDDHDGTRSPDDLLHEADTAMYARKHGMSSAGSLTTMTSRALSYHRLAMDGMQGIFAVLRVIREETEIVDFEIVEANALLRAELAPLSDQVVGMRIHALGPLFESNSLVPLYTEALTTGRSVSTEVRIVRADGRTGWADLNVVNVERDVIAIVATDITDVVESRAALDRERTRFASLIAGSSDLACVVDRSGAVVYAPPWDASFLGFTVAELTEPLSKVAPGDLEEAAAWLTEVSQLASGTKARSVVLRFVARDGSVHTCNVSAENRSDDPAVGGIVLNAHDASALVAVEAHLAAVADAVSEIIVITDAGGLVMWVSDAVRRELGLDPEMLIGSPATNVVHPDDVVGVTAAYNDMLNNKFVASPLNLRLRRADGSYHWFEATGRNRLDDPSIRGLVISLRDVSERRAAETALRASEERNRSIVEAAVDAIISVDTAGIIQTFNRAAERIFGIPAAQVIGEPLGGFVASDALSAMMNTSSTGGSARQIDTIATRANGETFAAHIAVSDVQVGQAHYHTAVIRDISDQRAMEHALRTAASCDDLTGLPNRRALLDRAQDAIDLAHVSRGIVGMVFIDLDRFKLVNDGLGHDAGDELLVLVANRIAGAIRVGDVVARLGSDEFAVLCPSADDLDAIKAVARRIVEAIGHSFEVAEHEVFIGASIGVSVSTGRETPLELLRFADTAMYRAKARGNPGVEVFDSGMENNAALRLGLESALRQATRRDELVAYYQPIVGLDDGRINSLEALVRWDRPGVGLLSPDHFIPVAEETGIILDIGPWVLRRAVDDCRLWQGVAPGVGVSVNVSVRQFESGDLVGTVRNALVESGLAPDLLTIEITESVMLEHSDRNAGIMRRIRDLGVHMSLDDFGSGYSSLTYLRHLPIDCIKIDRSFLQSLGSASRDDATLRAIVQLGAAHDLTIVAEGIDSDEKLALVRAVGCDFGQGFLFAKPMPFAQAVEYLGADQTRAWTTSR